MTDTPDVCPTCHRPFTEPREASSVTPGSYRHLILRQYLHGDLIDNEAATRAGVVGGHKRCAELRQSNLIAPTGERRAKDGGRVQCIVCAITTEGLKVLAQLDPEITVNVNGNGSATSVSWREPGVLSFFQPDYTGSSLPAGDPNCCDEYGGTGDGHRVIGEIRCTLPKGHPGRHFASNGDATWASAPAPAPPARWSRAVFETR